MKVNIVKYPTEEDWLLVKDTALFTIWKNAKAVPKTNWKTKILLSEHSPIRLLEVVWEWIGIPYCESVHFVRHNIGITPFVSTQRNDRQSLYDRRKAPQDALVNHRSSANAQAIIDISKVRLCKKASPETREAWRLFLDTLDPLFPELVSLCVPTCIYRNGICPEFDKCGYNQSDKFKEKLSDYMENFK